MKIKNSKLGLRVGIVGCGNIARIHIGYILQNIHQKNVAICDLNEIRAEAFADEFQICSYFTDLEEMLINFKPDVCHILTSPQTHAIIAVQCLKHDCHIYIEKPMCMNLKEADEIISISKKKKKLVCVGHQLLLERGIISAKKILESGKLGKIVNIIRANYDNFLEMSRLGLSTRWADNMAGGKFLDLLPHSVYLIYHFVPGFQFENAYSIGNFDNIVTDLHANFVSNEASGHIHISFSAKYLQNYIRIECTEGLIHIDLRNFVFLVRRKGKLPDIVERVLGNLSTSYQLAKGTLKTSFLFAFGKLKSYECIGELINQFYDAIIQDGVCPVPPEKGREVVSVSEKIVLHAFDKSKIATAQGSKKRDASQSKIGVVEKDASILVTGGTGFIGRQLVEKLARSGKKIKVLSRGTGEHFNEFQENVEVIIGDIADIQVLNKALKGVEIIYHLAAATKGNWYQHLDATVKGTKNILNSMIINNVKKLVYVSSAGVYDHSSYPKGAKNGMIDESFPYEKNPYKRGYYSNAKLKAEKLVVEYMKNKKINACIVRPGMVYGPGRPMLSVLSPHFSFNRIKKLLIVIGSGKRNLNLVYVEDLVDALILAGQNEKANGYVFNVVGNGSPTQREYINLYKNKKNLKLFTVYLPEIILRLGFKVIEFILKILFKKKLNFSYKLKCVSKKILYSTEEIENILDWKSKTSFEEGFTKTLFSQNK